MRFAILWCYTIALGVGTSYSGLNARFLILKFLRSGESTPQNTCRFTDQDNQVLLAVIEDINLDETFLTVNKEKKGIMLYSEPIKGIDQKARTWLMSVKGENAMVFNDEEIENFMVRNLQHSEHENNACKFGLKSKPNVVTIIDDIVSARNNLRKHKLYIYCYVPGYNRANSKALVVFSFLPNTHIGYAAYELQNEGKRWRVLSRIINY